MQLSSIAIYHKQDKLEEIVSVDIMKNIDQNTITHRRIIEFNREKSYENLTNSMCYAFTDSDFIVTVSFEL